MEWRKKVLIIFSPLLFLTFLSLKEEKKEAVSLEDKRSPSSVAPKNRGPHSRKIIEPRTLAAFEGKVVRHSMLRNRIPQSIEASLEKDPSVRLTKGYEFLKDVAAMAKEKFDPSMGKVIQRTDQFVYFSAVPGHKFVPVAISRTTNMLAPVSSILHIKGATPEIRSQLLGRGYTQYYYHPSLKLLSLESKPEGVMKTYSDLRDQGHKVELEVLKPHHQGL